MPQHESVFTVALTGGIASGKSAVAARFAALGADVIDADVVARELVAPGSPALAEIVTAFGAGVLDAQGALDRRAMRERVFANPGARLRLEAILHPRVRAALRGRAAATRGPYALLVIPLLVESGHYDWVDRVLVVDAPREVQRARLLARDGVTPQLADAMLDAQVSRGQRLALADDVIGNDGTLADLDAQVHALHARYIELARSHRGGA
ncbi:dephospho-CoA kinase [Dokdonella soli]|uniref:Dephospho-CoA kinase n=1 Tax=Dokdonella soli TaxID=529810 RepID=A0ABP3TSE8_9GAMM